LIVAALTLFPSDSAVQEAGCWAVAALSTNNIQNSRALGALGACALVAAAMEAFPWDRGVQERACGAVGGLACEDPTNISLLLKEGIPYLLAASLTMFPDNARVHRRACWAMANLSWDNSGAVQLAEAGACHLVSSALVAFPTHTGVQEEGLGAVVNLAASSEENARLLGEAGACELVVSALTSFKSPQPGGGGRSNRLVAKMALHAVERLASTIHPGYERLVAAGAPGAVVTALRAFPGDLALEKSGCEAVATLAMLPLGAEALGREGACSQVVAV
ncbi:unnamed protein product, partial [Discosporangium mesarthrocarpum]